MSRLPLLVTIMLMSSLTGCLNGPEDADLAPAGTALLAPLEVAPTGVVREWDLLVRGQTDLEVGGRHPFTLTFADEHGTPMLPGPEIRVKQGDTVRVRLHDGHHTIHWHGVRLPWGMDGVPGMTQAVGDGVFTYEFVAKDAGTFWYHCHVAAPIHVDWGMFGALIVEPADETEDPPFDREYTLFLHEMDTRSYALADFFIGAAAEGTVTPQTVTNAPSNPVDAAQHAARNAATFVDEVQGATVLVGAESPVPSRGYRPEYDLFMINGEVYPDTQPLGITSDETIRIRLINAGQLVHSMHLHGHRFLVTHKDGALLPAAYLADTIGLFPGERYDIYVTGDNPGHWDFHDHGGSWGIGAYANTDGLFPGGMQTVLVYEDWTPPAKLPSPTLHHHH